MIHVVISLSLFTLIVVLLSLLYRMVKHTPTINQIVILINIILLLLLLAIIAYFTIEYIILKQKGRRLKTYFSILF